MSDLVERLAKGDHPVTVGGPEPSAQRLKEAVERGYVHVKFTDTKGGTDLGVSLDRAASAVDSADFDAGEGMVHIEGTLTLDYVPARCVADLDLATLEGTGHLVIVRPDEDRDFDDRDSS
jgi:hypothetical protein